MSCREPLFESEVGSNNSRLRDEDIREVVFKDIGSVYQEGISRSGSLLNALTFRKVKKTVGMWHVTCEIGEQASSGATCEMITVSAGAEGGQCRKDRIEVKRFADKLARSAK